MKILIIIGLISINSITSSACAEVFDPEQFTQDYFKAWTATQSPTASTENVEEYLALLAEEVGHQHLPYDPDDSRSSEGKDNMREGMGYYLGVHTEYSAKLISYMIGPDVIVIKYDTISTGTHPQTKETSTKNYRTIEVLEIEQGKVSVIRKYSK